MNIRRYFVARWRARAGAEGGVQQEMVSNNLQGEQEPHFVFQGGNDVKIEAAIFS